MNKQFFQFEVLSRSRSGGGAEGLPGLFQLARRRSRGGGEQRGWRETKYLGVLMDFSGFAEEFPKSVASPSMSFDVEGNP